VRDCHFNFGSGSGMKMASGFLGIFFLVFETGIWSILGGKHTFVFLWFSSLCFNINFVHFLQKIFTNNYISGGFQATEKYWCHIEEDPERIRDPESGTFKSRLRDGIRDL
jgi:hypothetical protein